MTERRLFFLEKGVDGIGTSAEPWGLDGRISPQMAPLSMRPGETRDISFTVANTGRSLWRNSDWFVGPVRVGLSILSATGELSYQPRWLLPRGSRRGVLPGETVRVSGQIMAPELPGSYTASVQLVAEMVGWFGDVMTIDLTVA
jgi:hypothetical protein